MGTGRACVVEKGSLKGGLGEDGGWRREAVRPGARRGLSPCGEQEGAAPEPGETEAYHSKNECSTPFKTPSFLPFPLFGFTKFTTTLSGWGTPPSQSNT